MFYLWRIIEWIWLGIESIVVFIFVELSRMGIPIIVIPFVIDGTELVYSLLWVIFLTVSLTAIEQIEEGWFNFLLDILLLLQSIYVDFILLSVLILTNILIKFFNAILLLEMLQLLVVSNFLNWLCVWWLAFTFLLMLFLEFVLLFWIGLEK